jgi:hypothetical protein
MRACFVWIVFVGLFVTSARARVGDTVKQIERRYGKPQHVYNENDRPGVRKLGYRFHGWMVIVCFEDGISRWEGFTAWPEGDTLPRLSRHNVNEILGLSAREATSWQPTRTTKHGKYWVSSDKKTIAFFSHTGTSVIVSDPNFNE